MKRGDKLRFFFLMLIYVFILLDFFFVQTKTGKFLLWSVKFYSVKIYTCSISLNEKKVFNKCLIFSFICYFIYLRMEPSLWTRVENSTGVSNKKINFSSLRWLINATKKTIFFYRVSDFFSPLSCTCGWLVRLETAIGDTERADMIFCARTACLHSKFCDERPSCTDLNRAVGRNTRKFLVSFLSWCPCNLALP